MGKYDGISGDGEIENQYGEDKTEDMGAGNENEIPILLPKVPMYKMEWKKSTMPSKFIPHSMD